MDSKYLHFVKTKWFLFFAGLVIGALVILGIRFTTYEPERVHYHANFAVYINDQREPFKSMLYYEETEASSCTTSQAEDPLERAHMHGNVNDVVHVEDHLVTWGNFFQNLGWGLGDDYLKTADKIYTNNDPGKLTFMLNGKRVENLADQIINDQDKLLVSYGDASSDQLKKQYATISSTAHRYDVEQDPATCSGHKKATMRGRLTHMF